LSSTSAADALFRARPPPPVRAGTAGCGMRLPLIVDLFTLKEFPETILRAYIPPP
jgi:hypothetical protein